MSIDTFKSNWMTEEHEMVYESALKMFQSWEDRDEQWRENGKIDRPDAPRGPMVAAPVRGSAIPKAGKRFGGAKEGGSDGATQGA